MRCLKHVPLLVLAVVVAACESSPSAPDLEFDSAAAALDGQARAGQYTPLLPRLFAQAVASLRTGQGDAVADRASAEYRRLLETARAARAAGDTETARKRLEEARAVAARVVVTVIPNAPERVLEVVTDHLARLDARLSTAEANRRKAQVGEVVQKATRLRDAAREELRRGRAVAALLHASAAADLLGALQAR